MGLLSDALRHLLASDPVERRAGLRGLAGRMFGVEPVVLRHPSFTATDFEVVHFRKPSASSPRVFAVTATLGLAASTGRELVALTLADARDPAADRFAWLLGAVAAAAQPVERGGWTALPKGCLGRSSHTSAALTEPWPIAPRDLESYEQILGGRLDLVVPITAREVAFVERLVGGPHRGVDALVAAMRAQSVAPYADRPAGQTVLPAP